MTEMLLEEYQVYQLDTLGVITQTFSEMPEFLQTQQLSLRDGLAEYGRLSYEARIAVLDALDLDPPEIGNVNASINMIDGVVTSLRMKIPGESPAAFAQRSLAPVGTNGVEFSADDPHVLRRTLTNYARYYATDPQTPIDELVRIYDVTLRSSDYDLSLDEFGDGIPVVAQMIDTISTLYFPMVQSNK